MSKSPNWRGFVVALALALTALFPACGHAQDNITYSEFKFGVWDHDVHFLGGKEDGADINPEFIFSSPVTDDMIANAPWWLRFALQPRPTIGAAINTAGDTDQFYLGGTWSWFLTRHLVLPQDGIVFSFFFGPGFNDGYIGPAPDNRQALGFPLLFREAVELGYQINETWEISAYLDHISNGGLAKYNESINDVGLRLGYRF
jgi:lipid A 3-O-deacylase